jgi:peptidyl-tRNA hydrolase, PTH1 family
MPMDTWHLIAGLGNPGREYAQTRHNAGFLVVERFAERRRAIWKFEDKFAARIALAEFENNKLILCEPQTYMNLSGRAIGPLAAYYKVPLEKMVVVVDDADLPLGQLRLRPGGSSGGHHGLDSVEKGIGTRDYARLRIGIGRRDAGVREITGHVLGRFQPAETELLDKVLERAANQIECWISAGLEKAMNQFNGVIDSPVKKER